MKQVPLVIVTGYLGAGKTTLVRNLLPALDERGLKGLLIVNEVGDVNVDGAALGDAALEQRELLGGCACCSLRGDLYNALLEGIENYRPDYILLETSGLAEPSELLDAATAPKLRPQLEVTDVVTVVDAANLARQLKSGQLARMQASFASVLVLNKCDVASEGELDNARESLRDYAASAKRIECQQGEADPAAVLARTLAFIEGRWEAVQALGPGTVGKEKHDGHHHAHAGFFALNIDLPEVVESDALKAALAAITPKAYRIKGFARVSGSTRPWIFQRVGDLPPQATEFVLDGVDVPIGMVLIGSDLHEEDVSEAIAPISGRVRAVTS